MFGLVSVSVCKKRCVFCVVMSMLVSWVVMC